MEMIYVQVVFPVAQYCKQSNMEKNCPMIKKTQQ